MKKVLLIIPPESGIKDEKQTESKWPRIGLAYIASYIRNNGIDAKILDCKALELDFNSVANEIIQYKPDIVGMGPFTEEINESYKICKIVKKLRIETITVFGGPHASALPRKTLDECPELDLVVCGEGEKTMLEIAEGKAFDKIDGIAYRRFDSIALNKGREPIHDIDSLPYPAWDIFPLDEYRGRISRHLREKIMKPVLELPILSARGCPYKCIFCYKTLPDLRTRDPVNVVEEIEYNMKKYGATELFFVEGTFAANREQGIKICEEIINRKLNINWIVETRVNVVNEELLEKMKRAGCRQIDFGVESGDSEILKQSNKGITLDQVKEAVKIAKKVGLKVGCYFIIGHPFETRESINKTYKLARELDPNIINVGIMIPYPGTKVRELAEKGEGNYHLVCDEWGEYTKQRGGPLEMKNLSIDELRKIQSREYLMYYLRPKKMLFIIKNIPFRKMVKITKSLFRSGW